jgi:lipopolysaccharide/colanic/teichoic acid biosynthesis glycosyltransferase
MLNSSVLGPDAVRLSTENNTSQGRRSIIYIGGARKNLFDEMINLGYDVLSFNLSFPADLWLKYNALANANLPDAIVCDLELPDTDAFSLYESLKVNDRLKTVPFIIIAQHSNSLDRIKAFELGIDDFYSTDVSSDDLYNRIKLLNSIKKEKAKNSNVKEIPLTISYKIIWPKRVFDFLFSLTMIILLSPLMVIVAILIKLESKGPILYISKRVGTGYKIFNFYKFRTMQKDADLKLPSVMHLNEYIPENGKPSFFKVEDDPRVTRLGRILRKTCIDELPQLFNVLKGDMSMVGNRPLPLYEAENLTTDLWVKRFLAPAGITGLWQISKRTRHTMSERERKELDVAYADKSSLWFDAKIIFKTIPEVFSKLRQ